MNLRDDAIMKWCQKFRPDLIKYVGGTGERRVDDAFGLLLSIGFEAGRQFQAEHPKLALDNPNVYDPQTFPELHTDGQTFSKKKGRS